ncbi:MAG: cellulase family glycosylhydrolase [Anaerolineales bacterium]
MISRLSDRLLFALLALSAAALACGAPFQTMVNTLPAPTDSPGPTRNVPTQATAVTTPRQPHIERIGIRVEAGVGQFYETENGARFTPRGVNYVDFYPTERGGYEDRVMATNTYDPQRVRAAFRKLASYGYNTVRLFFDTCGSGPYCIGNADGAGLNPQYLDNMVDVMRIAADEGLYLILTANSVPEEGGYWPYFDEQIYNADRRPGFDSYQNADWLHPAGIEIKRRFWQDLMDGMVERSAPFETVLGWELTNELWLWKDEPPLSLTEGSVTISNGQTYDMANADQKRQMVIDGILYYFDQIVPIIKKADPAALTTVGFFAPQFPNSTGIGGDWYVDTAPLVEADNPIDFWDFHAYYDTDLGIPGQAENFGMIGDQRKPVVMGETGSGQAFFPSAYTGLTVGVKWIAQSCEVGFDGWLNWGYYPWPQDLDGKPWTFLDQDELLLREMSPALHANPCQVPELESANVVLDRPVRYSNQTSEEPASAAVDGSEQPWSAGGYPPQWIQIELARPTSVQRVGMSTSQWPPGKTHHQVWAVRGLEPDVLLADFSGFTTVDMSLGYDLPLALDGVTAVRISTIDGPSWAGWREVEVISSPPADGEACLARLSAPASLLRWPGPNEPVQTRLGRGIIVYLDGRTVAADGSLWRRVGGGGWLPEAGLMLAGDCGSDLQSAQPLPRTVPVTFEAAVPAETTGDVFLSGSFPETNLPAWLPWMILLQRSGGTYRVSIDLPIGSQVEYAYTRGSWETVERPASCAETQARTLTVGDAPMTVSGQVELWRDTGGCE